ncbi:hypothetical protein DL96DRAFT_1685578 [Flagelloscypha sp. PMI_526]|nr:hypothetical protein DL96DRAFT_1685578 [Flagelloscypha sp. PMI_526]
MTGIETTAADTTCFSAITSTTLPDEILLCIFNFAVIKTKISVRASWLLISKSLYTLIVPPLYHTLLLARGERISGFWSDEIDRTKLLRANPHSFSLVRRLKSHSYSQAFDFSIFTNVTHLSLWGAHRLVSLPTSVGLAVLSLPLEELMIRDTGDNHFLLRHLSSEFKVFLTLQRLVAFSINGDQPREGWLSCPNLTHIFAFCDNPREFYRSAIFEIWKRPGLKCYIIAPQTFQPSNWASTFKSKVPQDRRVVLLPQRLYHLSECTSQDCWDLQTRFWKTVEGRIQDNINLKDPTIIECPIRVIYEIH